jgi:hypothetical protein
MLSSDSYRAKAQRCLLLAQQASDAEAARLLRVVAADYLELALNLNPAFQCQQKMQSQVTAGEGERVGE